MSLRRAAVVLPLLLLPRGASAGPAERAERAELEARLPSLLAAVERDRQALNAECSKVASTDAAKVAHCRKRRDEVARRMAEYSAASWRLTLLLESTDLFHLIRQDEVLIPTGIKALAKQLGWSAEEQARLAAGLRELGPDGREEIFLDAVQEGWRAIWRSVDDEALARAADEAGGARAPVVGQQTKMDCAVAAVATAAGLSYDEVAARMKELVRQGEWRDPHTRMNPQGALDAGLNGGEVVLLAESLGKAEVVPSSRFEEVLKGGRPVMVNVATIRTTRSSVVESKTFGDHEVVLTKTFRRDGKPWFELADPGNPDRRFFVSAADLNLVLQEKGVAYGRDP